MESINNDMESALKERGHYLYVFWMREKMSKRKNKDGTLTYQSFLDKLGKWDRKHSNKES